jgi:[protein-PII] uridylyltransferase
MSQSPPLTNEPVSRLKACRAEVEAIRSHARVLFDGGATGIQVAAAISEATEAFVKRVFDETVNGLPEESRSFVSKNVSLIAVGGTGRGELSPYSDVDLLFLIRPAAKQAASDCISQAVRDYWDAGLRLGHAVRDVADTLSLARQEIDVATALVEARPLWGDQGLFDQLFSEFQRKIVRSRVSAFIDDCVESREKERAEFGSAVKQLEPDVKRSPGGLRDLHLLRWVAFARFATASVDSLRLQGALSRDEARILLTAYEFLKHIRVDLHFAAGRLQDLLVRDEQLRISEERKIEGTSGQRPVERFMQTYFQHSTSIAELSERFITLHRPRSVFSGLFRSLTTHRSDGIYLVANDRINVVPSQRELVLSSLEGILKFYRTAALYQIAPAAEFAERIREVAPRLDADVSAKSAELFLEIMNCHGNLGLILRSMFRTGILQIVIPPMAHARCLLQFNQYHSYTVDEHTLRAIEVLERFDRNPDLLGQAYRAVRKKCVLHLAMLLHDLGKGYDEDHSVVGRDIAERMANRLRMTDEDRDTLVFLVFRHLVMAHQAFRRDMSEYEPILEFSREVGSAERLRMLFVLTAADVTAVGPGVWTEWKSQLLSELYDRTLILLSGQDAAADPERRLAETKHEVLQIALKPDFIGRNGADQPKIRALLEKLPPHYLNTTAPERIALDLQWILNYSPGQIRVEGQFDPATQTVEYRIVTHENVVQGCFHKATGVLTAKRLEIASAQICTTADGFVIDGFRVHDGDFAGAVPPERIDEVADGIKDTLSGRIRVEELFQKHRRFGSGGKPQPVSDLPARVIVDSSSSERFTVVDVFSHDRPGLLYTLSRKIFELDLSVVLAKIATHLDQVVDVFYLTDRAGQKLEGPIRLKEIQSTLLATLDEFERYEWRNFDS